MSDSLWFLPGVFTLSAAILAAVTIQLDMMGVLTPRPSGEDDAISATTRLLFTSTPEGARGVLGAIATGLITVTGVIFSVTVVALQLASTQFTPRILRNFTADRGNQVVLGVFIATFTYALLVQRAVRGEVGEADSFVPTISLTVAMALTLVSIGFLIFFLDHAARSVQASVIIDRVTQETLHAIRRSLPERIGDPEDDNVAAYTPRTLGTIITSDRAGYIQGVDEDALLDLLSKDDLTVRMEPQVGDFVMPGSPLATVWPVGRDEEELGKDVRRAFVFGPMRTPHMDAELGIIELVDIAVKALSPGVNDPTTAVLCLDRLGEVLVELASTDLPGPVRRDPNGSGILIIPRFTYEHLVDTALTQIRHFGAGDPRFASSMLERLGQLGTLVPAERKPPLARQAAALLRVASRDAKDEMDRNRVERAGEAALDALTRANS
ncbi:MAG TPA: DUF2254 domain-containing protein [Longimicrobiales bacterium]|nr:DUF2254 domain-containing protein [Longimicrobiales bacterium]